MKIIDKIRHYWHELYGRLFGEKGDKFSMTCRDVVHQLNVNHAEKSLIDKFRLYLHLSLCEACNNYRVFSKFLKSKMNDLVKSGMSIEDVEKFNQRLLEEIQKKK